MLPRVPRKLNRDAQPNTHQGEQHCIHKVSPPDVSVERQCKQRRGCGWCDRALNRDHRLRDSIRSAERPLVGCSGGYIHKNRASSIDTTSVITHIVKGFWTRNLLNPMAHKGNAESCSVMSSPVAGFIVSPLEWRNTRFSRGNIMYTGQ